MYHFVRLTLSTLPYVLWLSLRGRVAVWKLELPERLGRRFGRVRPYRVWSRDEWLLAQDRAFDLWKTQALPLLMQRCRHTARLDSGSADFSRNLWQMLAMEFQGLCLLAFMLAKQQAPNDPPPRIVAPRIASVYSDRELKLWFPSVDIVRSPLHTALDNLHEWLLSAAHLGRLLVWFCMSVVGKNKSLGRRAVAWLGVSPQEIPEQAGKLDFTWAVRHGHARADEVVYFLPVALAPAQRSFLDSQGIAYVEPADTFAVLPAETRLRVLRVSIAAFFSAVTLPALMAPFVARFMTRAPYWDALFDCLGTQTYVTTTSYSWPEKPEVVLASARGIRTVIWAYSANTLTFTIEDRTLRDLGITRSIVIADEFWLWHQASAEWLARRRIELPGANCDIRVVGPLMCGDASLLELDAADARERLGLPRDGLCIGVFDMPPPNDEWRDRFGGGPPMVDTATYVEFWNVIERVVLRVPGAYALVKLKREFGWAYRDFPAFLREFLDQNGEHARAGRIYRVDVNVDPYLPIAACDIAVGLAYTSPVLAARTAGRPGYYLDPLGRANFPSHADLKSLTLNSEDELVAAVLRARDEPRAPLVPAAGVTPPSPVVPLAQPTSAAANEAALPTRQRDVSPA